MSKRGRKYLEAAAKIDPARLYNLREAVQLIKATVTTKFDPTVEVHARLGVDPRHADQQVRDVVVLPHGLGKTVRILVFAEGEDARLAREAGADIVADDELIKKIQEGWTDFDVAIAVPQMMGKVGRLGRVLGPRGLMPNPKTDTVGPNIAKIIQEQKAGKLSFKNDATGNVHMIVGKASFEAKKLEDNLNMAVEAIRKVKPATSKGVYIKSCTVTSTMGPAIKLDAGAAVV